MSPPFEFALAIALPVAAVYALIGGNRLLKWISEQQSRAPGPEPIEQVRADLVRLRGQLETMETRSDLPAKNLRLRALRTAYVDALNDACQRLGVSTPPATRVRPEDVRRSDIYRMEAALRGHGIDVRETSGR
jgi:hypothetical protein